MCNLGKSKGDALRCISLTLAAGEGTNTSLTLAGEGTCIGLSMPLQAPGRLGEEGEVAGEAGSRQQGCILGGQVVEGRVLFRGEGKKK